MFAHKLLQGLLLVPLLGPHPAEAQTDGAVIVAADDCNRLIAHRPAPDVAYRPGVDVDGAPVTPADLGRVFVPPVPDEVPVVIEIDLGGRRAAPPGIQSTAQVGDVVVRDGRAYLNGRPLTDDDMRVLSEACQRYRSR